MEGKERLLILNEEKQAQGRKHVGGNVKKENNVDSVNSSLVKGNKRTQKILPPAYDKDEKWVQEYMEQFGAEPSFF